MADLPAEIKVRVSIEMKRALADIAKERQLGTKLSDVCREAIQDYLARRAAQSGKIKPRKRGAEPAAD